MLADNIASCSCLSVQVVYNLGMDYWRVRTRLFLFMCGKAATGDKEGVQ